MYAYQMVRTDAREQKLDAFVVPKSLQETTESNSETMEVQEAGPSGMGGSSDMDVERSSQAEGDSSAVPTSSKAGKKRQHPEGGSRKGR